MVNILENMLIIDGKKYYKHNVFTKYAASKDGSIINIKTKRIIKMINSNGYLSLRSKSFKTKNLLSTSFCL